MRTVLSMEVKPGDVLVIGSARGETWVPIASIDRDDEGRAVLRGDSATYHNPPLMPVTITG